METNINWMRQLFLARPANLISEFSRVSLAEPTVSSSSRPSGAPYLTVCLSGKGGSKVSSQDPQPLFSLNCYFIEILTCSLIFKGSASSVYSGALPIYPFHYPFYQTNDTTRPLPCPASE